MFGLLYNLYGYCKKRTEKKLTLAVLGLDNAGKTTLLNTLQGEVDKDTTPTFGFNSTSLQEGKYTLEVFDLGGGKNIRSVWKKYLAEVHGIVYVVDAADSQRFEESRKTLAEVLENQFMRDKPILVFANKQDLPTAASAAEVVKSLGVSAFKNSHNVVACTAKPAEGQPVDSRLREGLKWLIGTVDRDFGRLGPRVAAEAEEVRQEEAKRKKEREERLRKAREEKLRQQKEEEERAREVEKENELHEGQVPSMHDAAPVLGPQGGDAPQQPGETAVHPSVRAAPVLAAAHGLPNTVESPGKFPMPAMYLHAPEPQSSTSNGSHTGRHSGGGAGAAEGGTSVGQAPGGLPPRPLSSLVRGASRDPSGAVSTSLQAGGPAERAGSGSNAQDSGRQAVSGGGAMQVVSRGSSGRSTRNGVQGGEDPGSGAGGQGSPEAGYAAPEAEQVGTLAPGGLAHERLANGASASSLGGAAGAAAAAAAERDLQDERGKASLRARITGQSSSTGSGEGGHRGSFGLAQHGNRVVPVAPA